MQRHDVWVDNGTLLAALLHNCMGLSIVLRLV